MSRLTLEQMSKGRNRFLEQNPKVKSDIELLTQRDAEILGITLDQLREIKTMEALGEYARSIREDSHEVFLSCIADTADEFATMKEAHLKAIANAMT